MAFSNYSPYHCRRPATYNMNPTVKNYLLYFFVFGIIMALFRWAEDNVEGIPFAAGKFAIRMLIYGMGMVLALYISNLVVKKKSKDKA